MQSPSSSHNPSSSADGYDSTGMSGISQTQGQDKGDKGGKGGKGGKGKASSTGLRGKERHSSIFDSHKSTYVDHISTDRHIYGVSTDRHTD